MNLAENTHKTWANVFGFRQEGLKTHTEYGNRIPAVWMRPNENKLHVCTALGDSGNRCWNSDVLPVGEWFNLKIKQYYDTNQYIYKIFIDGELQLNMVNPKPNTFPNVNGLLGNEYQPQRNYLTAFAKYRNFKLRTNEAPKYCIKITSGDDEVCKNHPKYSSWDGGAIELMHNNIHVATLDAQDTEMEYCVPVDQVNIDEDFWVLAPTSKDGVCITGLYVDGEQMLVGKNDDQSYFWLDANDEHCEDDNMSTRQMTIQAGQVYYSDCKSDIIRPNRPVLTGLTAYDQWNLKVTLNLEKNTNRGWSNLFGCQQQGIEIQSHTTIGARLPAAFLYSESNKLLICSAVGGNGNYCWASQETPINEDFDLEIRQFWLKGNYIYEILINDEVVKSVINQKPMTFENVDCIMSNTYSPRLNYKSVNGRFYDFTYESTPFTYAKDAIIPNKEVHSGLTVHPAWNMRITLNLEKNTNRGWSNVFGCQQQGTEDTKPGSRMPSVWLRAETNILLICSTVNGNGNYCFYSEETPVDEEFHLDIRQFWTKGKWLYEIVLQGEVVHSVLNYEPMTFENVDCLMANSYAPQRNYQTAWGRYHTFTYESSPFTYPEDAILPNKEVHSGLTVYPAWNMRITLNLHENTQRGWSNIFGCQQQGIDVLTDGKVTPGSRMPAAFLYSESNQLLICATVSGNGNYCWRSEEMPANEDFNLEIRQFFTNGRWLYEILLQGEVVNSVVNNQPMTFENVECLMSNSYARYNYRSVGGSYHTFTYESSPTIFSEDQILPNKVVHTGLTVNPTWNMKVTLNLEENTQRGWSNVFGCQQQGIDVLTDGKFTPGTRMPAAWLYSESNRLLICATVSGNGNFCWRSEEMPANEDFDLEIRQYMLNQKWLYEILLNGEVKRFVYNTEPMTFDNVDCLMGNSYDNRYPGAGGRYKDFTYESSP